LRLGAGPEEGSGVAPVKRGITGATRRLTWGLMPDARSCVSLASGYQTRLPGLIFRGRQVYRAAGGNIRGNGRVRPGLIPRSGQSPQTVNLWPVTAPGGTTKLWFPYEPASRRSATFDDRHHPHACDGLRAEGERGPPGHGDGACTAGLP